MLIMQSGIQSEPDAKDFPKLTEYPTGRLSADSTAAYLLGRAEKILDKNPKEARKLINKAASIAEKKNQRTHLYTAWHLMGLLEFVSGSYAESLRFYLKAIDIAEELDDTASLSRTNNNLGILMEKSGNTQEAREYYFKALDFYKAQGDTEGVASALNNLGNVYQSTDSLEAAMECYRRVVEIRTSLGDSLYLAYCYGNIGNLLLKKDQPDSAEFQYNKGLRIFEQLKDTAALARSFLNLATVKKEQGIFSAAELKLNSGLDLAKATNDKALLALYYETYADFYAETGNFRQAYIWRIKYETVHNSYLDEEKMRQMNEMQIKYESESKARQIQLLTKEHQLKELQLQQQSVRLERTRAQFVILVVIVVLILISGYLLIRSYRLGQKAQLHQEKIRHREDQLQAVIRTQEEERNRFARDLHDGLGQYMTALKMSIINFEQQHEIDEQERSRRFERIMKLFNDIYQELRNITFNIMPQVLLQKGLVPATEELIRKMKETAGIDVSLFTYGVSRRLNSEQEIAIYRIVQELLNNAVKHSGSNSITITFTEHEREFNIIVESNGGGFDKTRLQKSRGNGWKNILSRLELLGGTIEADSSPAGNNSTFIIDIPVNHE